jgi:Listeria-Bacteroides repeat domain (List_Bact_rpt)/Concanavalin A-like lectin/glucanases superfamily
LKSITSVFVGALIAAIAGSSAVYGSTSASLFFNINASDSGSFTAANPGNWNDLSVNNRNGTILKNGASGPIAGTLNYNATTGALEFLNSGQSQALNNAYVDMGDGFNNFGTGLTIEFEGHFGAVNQAWERIFDFGNGDADNNIWVGVLGEPYAPNALAIELWDGPTGKGRCISPDGALTPNVFAKFVITMDGSTCRMYKDGVQIQTRVGQCYSSGTCSAAALGSTYNFLPNNVIRTQNYIGRSNWVTDDAFNGAIKYVRIYTSAISSADVTVNSASHTLTYSTTGSTSGTAPAARVGNGTVTLASNSGSLAKTGHTFSGWATSANQPTALPASYNLAADVTLFPVLVPNTYTVTFDSQGGSNVANETFTHGNSLTYPSNPTKSGFSFLGWFSSPSGGSALTASAVASGNSDTTLHAQWSTATTVPAGSVQAVTTPSSTSNVTPLARTGVNADLGINFALLISAIGLVLVWIRKSPRTENGDF